VFVGAIAAELLEVLDRDVRIELITSRYPDFNAADAYSVGAEIVRRRRADGQRTVGRKVGFTNRTIWDEYGVHEPLWAHVYDRTVTFLDGTEGSVSVRHLAQPRIEPEIIFGFRQSPGDARSEEELLASIDWVAHGFEIVQCHYPDWKFQPADAIASFGLHGALVIGPRTPIADLPNVIRALRTFEIDLSCNAEKRASGGGFNVLDSPLLAASHFLTLLATQPELEPLQAGEVVTTGTLTAALPIATGEVWSTQIRGLDLPGLQLRIK
jgi:2-keto-4-pentenoate hydratase